MLGDGHKSLISSLCNFIQSPVTASLFCPNIFFSYKFSLTHSLPRSLSLSVSLSLSLSLSVVMLQFCTAFCSQYMHIYLVFSAFTSISTALLATNKACVFFLIVWMYLLKLLSSSASTRSFYIPLHLSTFHVTWTFLIAYSEAKSKGNCNKASPCVRPF